MGFGVRFKAKNKMLLDIEKWGVSKCSGRPIVTFLLKKIGFALWPEIMLSQKLIYYWQEIFFLTLTLDSEAILWLYHCIVCEVNQTVERVINLNVTWLLTWFCFRFNFVRPHTLCGCCSTVCLCSSVVEIKHADCKMSPKNVNSYK